MNASVAVARPDVATDLDVAHSATVFGFGSTTTNVVSRPPSDLPKVAVLGKRKELFFLEPRGQDFIGRTGIGVRAGTPVEC